jgi:mevalonate kinase
VILFGEHAVVYGRPALAIPVTKVRAEAVVESGGDGGLTVVAHDLNERLTVRDAPADHPLAAAARLALDRLGLSDAVNWRVEVRSTIPIASGLGSGAAVSAAIIRALADAAGAILPPAEVADLVFEVDRLHHGTPSGIDNTVIAYEQPVYFVRGQPPQRFPIGRPFMLAIADTGIRSPTRITVGDVRRARDEDPERYDVIFDRIAAVVEAACSAIAAGQTAQLGPLMDENHVLLSELDVSSPELEQLAAAARGAGAGGAKLSGGGRGGNLIALVMPDVAEAVAEALRAAGAARVILTTAGDGAERS